MSDQQDVVVVRRADVEGRLAGPVPRKVEPFPPLDEGDVKAAVVVRGLTLTQRLQLRAQLQDAVGEHAIVPLLLATAIVDADDKPLATAAEWEAFGSRHAAHVVALFNTAYEMSGLDGEANRKNS